VTSFGRFPVTTTPDQRFALKSAVEDALASLRSAYGENQLLVVPDGQGGAWAEIQEVEIGSRFVQPTTFIVFLLPFNLPGADIYPMFIRNDLARRDSTPLGDGLQLTTLSWSGQPAQRPVIQISRRTRGGAFTSQTAAQKVEKVLEWLRNS
jgi:hypothetical protein